MVKSLLFWGSLPPGADLAQLWGEGWMWGAVYMQIQWGGECFPHCLIAFGAKSGILEVTSNPKDQYLLWDTEG